uniref:Beta-ketoacyl-[acyl-carrier-protein] synthase III n=1 Tax=Leachiella pacifica TaxID=282357 RepID=A0A3S8UVU4_9FLOR|nr:beta-ketoacyl-acyl carrier protein synthase III [Leachiella pacifica]
MKSLMIQGAKIIATGSAIPSTVLSNDQLSQTIETSDQWISIRTGIKTRRLLKGLNQSIVDLAVKAANKALNKIIMDPSHLDLIILATSSPNNLFGSASQIQSKIGASNAVAFDLTAACSGFILGLVTGYQFLSNGHYKNILIIGADVLSKWIDWSDRSTCILFGDAAGAAILQACSIKNNSILNFKLNTNGHYSKYLSIEYKEKINSISTLGLYKGYFNYITMNGKEVYKFAVSQVPLSILACLNFLKISTHDINWLLLHQANKRILYAVAEKLGINKNKIISNLSKYGNTSAASIPLALDEAVKENKILNNDIIVLAGFGAGLTWGTIILQW